MRDSDKTSSVEGLNRFDAVLVSKDLDQVGDVTSIRVDDVVKSIELLKNVLYKNDENISLSLSGRYKVGLYSVIDPAAQIGDRTIIGNHVTIGPGVTIGEDCCISDGVKIYAAAQIGNHVRIKDNSVIGGDGFGYYFDQGYHRIRHVGSVVIRDHVDIGSNCCIDRGTLHDTIIHEGTKLDNLIHIAHNVTIGKGVAIAAQSGISGSANIGEFTQLGGQVGVVGHITIAAGSKIQAQSGVATSITKPNRKWYGYPAMRYWDYLRSYSFFKKLPLLERRLSKLEDRMNDSSDTKAQ